MKRLITVFGLVLVLGVLALPAVAQADNRGPVPTGWTWDEV